MEKNMQELLAENPHQKLSLQEVLDTYSHIELSEEESLLMQIEAKRKKETAMKLAESKRIQQLNRKMLTEYRFSFEQTKSLMQYRMDAIFHNAFRIDDSNRLFFDLLCYYFSEDVGFESLAENAGIKNPSLKKGIMLAGNFGVGKTWLMKLFSQNQRQVYHMRFAKEIANEFQLSGEDAYTDKPKNATNDRSMFYQPFAGLCIDDIGTEDIKTHFGNKKNVIGDLIETRYAKGNTGIFLHGTTNLRADQLTEFYGGRVESRMREVFNFIELTGNDRRK